MHIVILLLIGGVIGTLSGVLGIGGGVLLIPALMWLCGHDYPRAAGTSLAILVPPIGFFAAREAYHQGRVDLQAAVWIALAFALSAWLGSYLVQYLPISTLRFCFGLMLLMLAGRMILSADANAANAAAGLCAAASAWLIYLGLRILGRRHAPPAPLGEIIRAESGRGRGNSDYQI